MGKAGISIGKKRKIKKLTRDSLNDIDEITWYLENDLDLIEFYNKREEEIEKIDRTKNK